MPEPETLSQALTRLEKAGYVEDFRATKDGLKAGTSGKLILPENLVVDETVRFEGESDIDDEEAIFALSEINGNLKGTYTVAFGTDMDSLAVAMVQKLCTKPR